MQCLDSQPEIDLPGRQLQQHASATMQEPKTISATSSTVSKEIIAESSTKTYHSELNFKLRGNCWEIHLCYP